MPRPFRALRRAGARRPTRIAILATLFAPAEHRDALVRALCLQPRDRARARAGARADAGRNPPAMVARSAVRASATARRRRIRSRRRCATRSARYRLAGRAAAGADRGACVRSLRRADGDGRCDLELYAIQTQSPLFALAARIPRRRQRRRPISSRSTPASPMRSPGCCERLAGHAARRQLYVPVGRAAAASGRTAAMFLPDVRRAPLRAALAEMRELAREHLGAAQAQAGGGAGRNRAGVSAAGAGAARRCAAWSAPAIDPFALEPNCAMAAAMDAVARGARSEADIQRLSYSAAAAGSSPAIQRSRSASARALSALLRARFLAEPRPNLRPSRRRRGCGERREQAEIHVHRLERAGPASIVSIWPPVMCASSAPCAVVGGGGTSVSPRRSAAAKRPASSPIAADST